MNSRDQYEIIGPQKFINALKLLKQCKLGRKSIYSKFYKCQATLKFRPPDCLPQDLVPIGASLLNYGVVSDS